MVDLLAGLPGLIFIEVLCGFDSEIQSICCSAKKKIVQDSTTITGYWGSER
jgi:hypothetical protein